MKNSREVILFSIECSSCTRLAPNTRETRALNRRVDEFLTYKMVNVILKSLDKTLTLVNTEAAV